MPTTILMPQLGMGMTEGTVVRWLVEDGARVARGQELLEFETDKVTNTIESPADGILQRSVEVGATVPVRTGVGHVLAEGEARAPAPSAAPPTQPQLPQQDAAPPARVLASPIARRLAAEHGIDLTALSGTGPGGRITEADVRAAIEAAVSVSRPPERRLLQRIPLTGRRKLIAERMRASLAEAAQLTISREADATELVEFRQSLAHQVEELGVRVSYDALLVKALATALREMPTLNAVVEGDALLVLEEIHVAVAVATEEGLVVPVVRDADRRSLVDVAEEIAGFARRARQGQLTPDELAAGTITLTNLGAYGVDTFTPILNPPQSAILGVGRIAPRGIVRNGKVIVAPTVHLSLTWDHRVADGVPAARLLDRVAGLIDDRSYFASLA